MNLVKQTDKGEQVMSKRIDNKLDYSQPIEIGEGVYWIGYADDNAGLHCNPYIIVDGDEAVLIDGGSRNDFSTVMMKILQTGINPNSITRLIYQHYDPDLCGSVPHFESMIKNDDLKILSHRENNIFIRYYQSEKPKVCIETIDYTYTFKSGRKLSFIKTPYSHSPGSFMTYDHKTKILFSSDIFGSYNKTWELYLEMYNHCLTCSDLDNCAIKDKACPIKGINNFHERIMTSKKALDYALDQVEKLEVEIIAPQHGSLLVRQFERDMVIQRLRDLKSIGIDGIL